MTCEEERIRNIIDSTVINCMNNEPHLLGTPKEEVTIEHLTMKTRHRERVILRHLCMYICDFIFNDVLNANYSDKYIGSFYNKDHSTVIHSKNVIKNFQDTSKQILRMTAYCIETVIREIDNGEISLSVGLPYSMLYPAYY